MNLLPPPSWLPTFVVREYYHSAEPEGIVAGRLAGRLAGSAAVHFHSGQK